MTETVKSLREMAGEAVKRTPWSREVIRAKRIVQRYKRHREIGLIRDEQFNAPHVYEQRKREYTQARQVLNRVARHRFGASSYDNLRHEVELPAELDWV